MRLSGTDLTLGDPTRGYVGFSLERSDSKSQVGQRRRATPKKLDYPEITAGSRLAAQARKMANNLTREERREHSNAAMAMIYAGANKVALPRR